MKHRNLFAALLLAGITTAASATPTQQKTLNLSLTATSTQLGAAETGSAAPPQVKDDLFAGTEKFAANASDVNDVNLDGKMLGMMGKGKGDMAGKMHFVIVRSYSYDKPGQYKLEDVEAYTKKLQDGSWNCLIHTRERKSGESTDICSRSIGDTNELVIVTAEPKELTFVHLKGKVSLNDLQNWNKKDKSDK